MVFAEVETTAIADELAARARVGDFEPNVEAGIKDRSACRTGTRTSASTQFEISLDPEEEISDVFTEDITAVPDESSLSLEKVQEAPPLSVEGAAPEEKLEVDDLVLELELVEALPAESPRSNSPLASRRLLSRQRNPKSKNLSRTQSYCKNPEPIAEVSEVLLPSTTAELKPEPKLDIDESDSCTIQILPSCVEESTPAFAPVASDASIPLDSP